MILPIRPVLILLLLAVAASPALGQHFPGGVSTDWEKDRLEYRADVLRDYNALMETWRTALEKRDARTAGSLYSDAAYVRLPERQLVSGRSAIQGDVENLVPNLVEIRTGLTDFVASSRLAYALGPFWYQYRTSDGSLTSVTGTYLAVLVREGSKWKIRSQVFDPEAGAGTGDR
jgi:ketosteroid isomerase-like protein